MLDSQLPHVEGVNSAQHSYVSPSLFVFSALVFLIAVGLGGILYGTLDLSGAAILMSGTLLAGVLWAYQSVFGSEAARDYSAFPDSELLRKLVGLNRRATLLTDLRGGRLAGNTAFEFFAGDPTLGIRDLIKGEEAFQGVNRLINDIRRQGEGEVTFPSAIKGKSEVTLSGRRISNYILWELRGEGTEARVMREIAFMERWAQPLLQMMEGGALIEDGRGNVRYINDVLAEWIGGIGGLQDGAIRDFSVRDGLLRGPRGVQIEVAEVAMPFSTREDGHYLGRARFFRNLDRRHAGPLSADGAFLDPVFDAAPLGIAIVDEKGALKETNQSFLKMARRAKLKRQGNVSDLVTPEGKDALLAHIKDAHEGRAGSRPLDVQLVGSDARQAKVSFSTLYREDEAFVAIYLMDITQERRLEQQFTQAQKLQAVGQLAGGVAHDFNNLLTAIIGFCDLLLVRYDTADQSYSDLIQIKQNANRAANLVRQLLAFSRQQTMRPEVLDLTDVLADLMHLIRRLIGEPIDLKVSHGRNLPKIKVDQGQLEQVIINLAVNARDAMPEGGLLELRTREVKSGDPIFDSFHLLVPGHYVMIEVRDTGVGIANEDIEKIFEPFFTTKEVGQGTGLGLATVYGIVKQTGGYVFCKSELGKGTSFFIFLKVYEGEEPDKEDTVEEVEARDLTGTGTILLVEDEDPVRLFASRALASKGYEVVEAPSGREALNYLAEAEGPIALIITDVVMPEMDGPALVAEVRKTLTDVPVIFMSGYAEDILRKDLEDPDNYFLSKPFSLKAMAELVKEVLGGK